MGVVDSTWSEAKLFGQNGVDNHSALPNRKAKSINGGLNLLMHLPNRDTSTRPSFQHQFSAPKKDSILISPRIQISHHETYDISNPYGLFSSKCWHNQTSGDETNTSRLAPMTSRVGEIPLALYHYGNLCKLRMGSFPCSAIRMAGPSASSHEFRLFILDRSPKSWQPLKDLLADFWSRHQECWKLLQADDLNKSLLWNSELVFVWPPSLVDPSACHDPTVHLNPENVALITIQKRAKSPGLKRHTGPEPRKWNSRFRPGVVSVRDHSSSCWVLKSAAGWLRTAEASEAAWCCSHTCSPTNNARRAHGFWVSWCSGNWHHWPWWTARASTRVHP